MLALVSGIALYAFTLSVSQQPGPHAESRLIVIEKGAGLFQIKFDLWRAGLIRHPLHFQLSAILKTAPFPQQFTPLAGEYEIPAHASIVQIMQIISSGKTHQHRLTIPEGFRSYDVMLVLNELPFLTSVILHPPPEGSLFPDTYFYSRGTNRLDLLARMQRQMEITLAETWATRAPNLPLKTPEDLLKLASIIEKETAQPHERARIAGVFINRLRRNMRLQSDPTVAYGLALDTDLPKILTRSDLANAHAWNTYRHRGLPKTAIANPGYEALQAAAHPESHEYLYFVADGRGGHNFAKTLAAHNAHVRHYRQQQRQQKE